MSRADAAAGAGRTGVVLAGTQDGERTFPPAVLRSPAATGARVFQPAGLTSRHTDRFRGAERRHVEDHVRAPLAIRPPEHGFSNPWLSNATRTECPCSGKRRGAGMSVQQKAPVVAEDNGGFLKNRDGARHTLVPSYWHLALLPEQGCQLPDAIPRGSSGLRPHSRAVDTVACIRS